MKGKAISPPAVLDDQDDDNDDGESRGYLYPPRDRYTIAPREGDTREGDILLIYRLFDQHAAKKSTGLHVQESSSEILRNPFVGSMVSRKKRFLRSKSTQVGGGRRAANMFFFYTQLLSKSSKIAATYIKNGGRGRPILSGHQNAFQILQN